MLEILLFNARYVELHMYIFFIRDMILKDFMHIYKSKISSNLIKGITNPFTFTKTWFLPSAGVYLVGFLFSHWNFFNSWILPQQNPSNQCNGILAVVEKYTNSFDNSWFKKGGGDKILTITHNNSQWLTLTHNNSHFSKCIKSLWMDYFYLKNLILEKKRCFRHF